MSSITLSLCQILKNYRRNKSFEILLIEFIFNFIVLRMILIEDVTGMFKIRSMSKDKSRECGENNIEIRPI